MPTMKEICRLLCYFLLHIQRLTVKQVQSSQVLFLVFNFDTASAVDECWRMNMYETETGNAASHGASDVLR